MLVAFVPALLLVGCVDLKKPMLVEECEKAPGGCTNDWRPTLRDAGEDTAEPSPDLAPSDDPMPPKKDLGPDTVPAAETADVVPPGKETGDDGRPSDPIAPTETQPEGSKADGKTDLLADKEPAGPEPAGAEPGPERGSEPGAEPGPEPGPEPGKEPGA
jgi:hypothetical protein